jgi:hypothetical protein
MNNNMAPDLILIAASLTNQKAPNMMLFQVIISGAPRKPLATRTAIGGGGRRL